MLEGIDNYRGREQSWVKHYVLSRYLQQFGQIIGFKWPSITYVDGFCGPWNSQSTDLSDTSFSIAIKELQNAQLWHPTLRIRCIFCEPKRKSFLKLSSFTQSLMCDRLEIHLMNKEFEAAIPDILKLISDEPSTFTFSFIDPTGWTGFSMEAIAPLLKLSSSEVMITFMLDFIKRFFGYEASRESFFQLFGVSEFPDYINELRGIDRDDEIAEFYRKCLKNKGTLKFVQRFIVLNPSKERSHFELMYATGHTSGVRAFKKAEEEALQAQERIRASLESQRKNQPLFIWQI